MKKPSRQNPVTLLCCLLLIFVASGMLSPLPLMASETMTEQAAELIENAERLFEQEQYLESFANYQAALGLDPTNRQALDRVFDLARLYQEQAKLHGQQGNDPLAQENQQQAKKIVRYLLSLLTKQFKRSLQRYSQVKEADPNDAAIRQERVAVVKTLLIIVRDIKRVYEEYQQKTTDTGKIVDRLQQAISDYEQELSSYE